MSNVPRKRLSLLLILVLFASLITGFASQQTPAIAASWPVTVDVSIHADTMVVGPSGNVSLVECGHTGNAQNDSPMARTYDQNANVVGTESNIGSDYVYLCDQNNVAHARADGTLFGVWVHGTQSYAVGVKNGVLQWQSDLVLPCTNPHMAWPYAWADGADGNVYFVLGGECGSTTNYYLVGLNAATGQDLFPRVHLNGGYNVGESGLAAYSDGLIVKENTLFRYFSYSGIEAVAKRYTAQPGYVGIRVESWKANANGRLFINLNTNKGTTLGCAKDYVSTSIVRRDPDGSVLTYDTAPYCVYQGTMATTTPSGGALFEADTQVLTQESHC